MTNRYDIKNFAENLKKLRKQRHKENPELFNYCKTHETFAQVISSEKTGQEDDKEKTAEQRNDEKEKVNPVDRRTVLNWEHGKSYPSLKQLVEICSVLDCEISDLVSNDENEPISQNTRAVSEFLGLDGSTTRRIKDTPELQRALNFFLNSKKLPDVMRSINDEIYMRLLNEDILNAYSSNFQSTLKQTYAQFRNETFPLEQNVEKFQERLTRRISYARIKDYLQDYLDENLNDDRLTQIKLALEENNKSGTNEEIYQVFIEQTADFSYDLLKHLDERTLILDRILQSIGTILDVHMQQEVKRHQELLRATAKEFVWRQEQGQKAAKKQGADE